MSNTFNPSILWKLIGNEFLLFQSSIIFVNKINIFPEGKPLKKYLFSFK